MVVEVIGSQLELEEVEPFFVEELLWGTKSIPKTYGYLGFEKGVLPQSLRRPAAARAAGKGALRLLEAFGA